MDEPIAEQQLPAPLAPSTVQPASASQPADEGPLKRAKTISAMEAAAAVQMAIAARKDQKAGAEPKAETEKPKAKAKAKAKAKEKAKADAKGKPVKNRGGVPDKNPTISWERTRQQIMCRTGIAGAGQCHAIKYNPKQKGSDNEAWARAEKWLAAELKKRG